VEPLSNIATINAERVAEGRERILAELRKVIVGQDDVVEQVLIAPLHRRTLPDYRGAGACEDAVESRRSPRSCTSTSSAFSSLRT
jgi:hypothetical protein